MLLKFIGVVALYLFVTLGEMSGEHAEALKTEYRDHLTPEETIDCSVIKVSHKNTADELAEMICGKGKSFEDGENYIKEFKENYINKMIKVTGRIKKIDSSRKLLIFENNVKCMWNVVSIKAIVDDTSIYQVGEKVDIVGRCLCLNTLCELYIDGSQILQDVPDYSIPTSNISKLYDMKMCSREICKYYKENGYGNKMFLKFNDKIIQTDGYVTDVYENRIILSPSKKPNANDIKIDIYYPGAKRQFNKGENTTLNVKYVDCNIASNSILFSVVR